MLIKLVFTLVVIQLQTSVIKTQVCTSTTDPNLRTFDGTSYAFNYEGPHFIMYTDKKDTRVTAGFQRCSPGSSATCNCAVYVKLGDAVAFLDFCRATQYNTPLNKFYTVKKNTEGIVTIKPMECKPISPAEENNEATWSTILAYSQFFKCAKIGDGTYVTYVLRSYDPRSPGDSVKVKVNVRPLLMPQMEIYPAINSFSNTGGLCGMWNNNRNKDLYVLNQNGVEQYGASNQALSTFWSLDTIWKQVNAERCPECFIKIERKLYCPCDNFSLSDELNPNIIRRNFCDVPMPTCVERSLNIPESQLTNNTGVTTPPTSTKPPITTQVAQQLCSNAILNNPGLKPLIDAGIFDPTEAINNCVADLVLSNEQIFIQIHVELSITQALQLILQNGTFYQNGTITEAGLDLLIGLCPAGCSGNGQCVINQNCLGGVNINIADCLSPVMCLCEENFGGPGCETNTLEPPEFFLNKKCCDVKNYDCDVITGYGYPIARKTKLFSRIVFRDGNAEIGSISGTATIVSDNEFTIQLPLDIYLKTNKSHVDVTIGLSYDGIKYNYESLQLYDSNCRFCEDSVLPEPQIKDETCLIDNQCFDDGELEPGNEDNICNATLGQFEWTYIGYVSPECNESTHRWSQWYNLDEPSGDGDIEILTLRKDLKCNVKEIEVFTIDDVPSEKTKQKFYQDKSYGFICLNKDQSDGNCLNYKIRQCCAL